MTKKTLIALGFIVAGMAWVYQFFPSETKTTDLWLIPMGVMMMFHGLEKLMEDHNAAEAKVFGKIANACFILAMAGGAWWLLRQA